MAVKQNNSDDSNSSIGSESASASASKTSTTTPKTKSTSNATKKPSHSNENINESSSPSNNNHNNALSHQQQQQSPIAIHNVTQNTHGENLQLLIGCFYSLTYNEDLYASQAPGINLLNVSNSLLQKLSCCPLSSDPQVMKTFKEDIIKVGEIFEKAAANNPHLYLSYLQQVSEIIATHSPNSEPSGAIAIIFEIFPKSTIPKHVSMVLSGNDNATDDTIKRTVTLMSDWLRHCTFCTNLHLWILAILKELREQKKFDVLMDIVHDIIEKLFLSLIVPVLRPKVYPIVFKILKSIKDTPVIFHKIIKRAPNVLRQLRKECATRQAEEVHKIYQELIDLLSALMEHYPVDNNLYEEMEELLIDCHVSQGYRSLLDNSIWGPDLVIETSFSNPRVGLVNLGNTCYMNSVLQAMVMTKDFTRELLLSDCKTPLLQKVQQLFAQLIHSQRPELVPSTVLHATRPEGFVPGFQQDSSEFLGYLLETLHEQEACAYIKQKRDLETNEFKDLQLHDLDRKPPSSIDSDMSRKLHERDFQVMDWPSGPGCGNRLGGVTKMDIDSEDSTSHSELSLETLFAVTSALPQTSTSTLVIPTPPTIIDQIFTGKIATTYNCLTCDWESKNIDNFRDFPLSFPEALDDFVPNYSVQDLLNYYCSPETLSGDNQYYCEQCKKLCDAKRYINVVHAPRNLILTLKQFTYDQNNHIRAKLMHNVFHDENIKLTVFDNLCQTNPTEYAYVLYAAVVHSGFSMDSGHYYTYATDYSTNSESDNSMIGYNNSSSNDWYKFNDNIVTACKITELHKLHPPNTPYVLFYRMQSKINTNFSGNGVTSSQAIDPIQTPSLDELPSYLREIVKKDNATYIKETKLNTNMKISSRNIRRDNNSGGGGDDDDQPPPPNNCGGNAYSYNINKFIF